MVGSQSLWLLLWYLFIPRTFDISGHRCGMLMNAFNLVMLCMKWCYPGSQTTRASLLGT